MTLTLKFYTLVFPLLHFMLSASLPIMFMLAFPRIPSLAKCQFVFLIQLQLTPNLYLLPSPLSQTLPNMPNYQLSISTFHEQVGQNLNTGHLKLISSPCLPVSLLPSPYSLQLTSLFSLRSKTKEYLKALFFCIFCCI